jgi:arginyl-tRNA synthetase
MLAQQKLQITALMEAAAHAAVKSLVGDAQSAAALPTIALDRPKQASLGDVACNLAMQIAKPMGKNPRDVAQAIVTALMADTNGKGVIESAEIAGPGFINLRLVPAFKQSLVTQVLTQGKDFGKTTSGANQPVVVEFVSANPTGPLHVGHARQGALGDILSSILQQLGYVVTREFYYNDAGQQIHNLAISVQARLKGVGVDDPSFPEQGYRGPYILDIANDYMAGKTVSSTDVAPVKGAANLDDLDAIRVFAVAYLRNEQDQDLKAFGVRFDHYFLESSLYSDGKVDNTVERLQANGKTFEEGGALWFKSTEYGDDKDRVMRKSEGGYTYFVPDIAYHVNKWQRGFTKAINVQGSDHHGTIARVRAGLQAVQLDVPLGYPDYVLHKMVRVMKGGEEVKMSKRAGTGVTLRDLIEWSGDDPALDADQRLVRGRDAVRFFLGSRKGDSEYVFDVDLALARSDENPVYYIQYAHARICRVLGDWGGDLASLNTADVSSLVEPQEFALMARLSEFAAMLESAAHDLAPHNVAFYLKDLAADFHSYYNAHRVLSEADPVRLARLALWSATRQVLRNGLAVMGVSAPERM